MWWIYQKLTSNDNDFTSKSSQNLKTWNLFWNFGHGSDFSDRFCGFIRRFSLLIIRPLKNELPFLLINNFYGIGNLYCNSHCIFEVVYKMNHRVPPSCTVVPSRWYILYRPPWMILVLNYFEMPFLWFLLIRNI